jgi:hypothetical protein
LPIALDASFAPAHAALACAYQFLTQLRGPRDLIPKIRAATDRFGRSSGTAPSLHLREF